MKIERISENQIRCILTKQDLQERNLKLSELAYGSERAKALFREMMEQANMDFGFEAEDIPIMIEAIPASRGAIVLVITKVEDPEEFEDRLSHVKNIGDISGSGSDSDFPDEDDLLIPESFEEELENEDDDSQNMSPKALSEELIDCFGQLGDILAGAKNSMDQDISVNSKKKKKKEKKKQNSNQDFCYLFCFTSLEKMIEVAREVSPIYKDKSTLWKDETDGTYYLFLTKGRKKKDDSSVLPIINQISEFAKIEQYSYATKDFLNEHCKVVVKDQAISTLANF